MTLTLERVLDGKYGVERTPMCYDFHQYRHIFSLFLYEMFCVIIYVFSFILTSHQFRTVM